MPQYASADYMNGFLNYKVFALLALMLSCKNTKDFDCLDFFNTKSQSGFLNYVNHIFIKNNIPTPLRIFSNRTKSRK